MANIIAMKGSGRSRRSLADLPAPMTPLPVWVPPGPGIVELTAGTVAGLGAAMATPLLEGPVLRAIGGLLAPPAPGRGEERAGPARAAGRRMAAAGADPGWFGPGSVAWKVHADASIFVAGVTAFALQALHPLALAGVVDHSSFADDFLGRVRRTGEFVSGVIYGTSADAAARVATVQRVHRRVVGTAPDGRPYDASDPDLLEWVHVTEYLAIASAFRRFGLRPLGRDDLDRYVAEVAVVGEAMGVAAPPRSWAELDASFQSFRPDLAVGEQVMAAAAFLRTPPGLPPQALRVWRLLWRGAQACLPPTGRRLLGLSTPGPAELAACRVLVRSLGTVLREPPPLTAARRRLDLDIDGGPRHGGPPEGRAGRYAGP